MRICVRVVYNIQLRLQQKYRNRIAYKFVCMEAHNIKQILYNSIYTFEMNGVMN